MNGWNSTKYWTFMAHVNRQTYIKPLPLPPTYPQENNNEKCVWLDEIGNHPDRQADRYIARLWMAKSQEMTM
jgi:hypothetical protein